jgi:hypothetical protein
MFKYNTVGYFDYGIKIKKIDFRIGTLKAKGVTK